MALLDDDGGDDDASAGVQSKWRDFFSFPIILFKRTSAEEKRKRKLRRATHWPSSLHRPLVSFPFPVKNYCGSLSSLPLLLSVVDD